MVYLYEISLRPENMDLESDQLDPEVSRASNRKTDVPDRIYVLFSLENSIKL